MIRLKNITNKYHVIECDIFPEDSETAGKLVVDAKDEKILEYSLPKGYEYCKNHVQHAFDVLIRLHKANELPTEKLIMWY